jgi:2,3-bisphosphoglycerate-independent phosphoglycerate mutase
MKYAMILPHGAADEPLAQLDGRTPIEVARTPNLDWIGMNGRQGRVATGTGGDAPDSDTATLTLLGYSPRTDHLARGPLEAAARGTPVRPGRLVFRCSLVTVTDGRMEDRTGGRVSQTEAERLIADLNEHIGDTRCHFVTGASYRALMIASDMPDCDPRCTPPHEFPDGLVSEHLPHGRGADWVRAIMERAGGILGEHDVNVVRRDLGENPADAVWLWGPGRPRPLEPFVDRFGIRGAVISGVDLPRGIARSLGLERVDVPGATGYLDTDYAAKGAAAAAALESFDLVMVHIHAADEASHRGDADAKIEAIEQIDAAIVGPLLDALRRCDAWRLLVAPVLTSSAERRTHTATPPPFCLAGQGVHTVLGRPFTERAAESSDLQVDPGHELMEYFLKT